VEVVVSGIGLLWALGSLESSWRHLIDEKSVIGSHQPFPDLPSRPLALMGQATASLEKLIQQVVAEAVQIADLSLPLPDCGVASGGNQILLDLVTTPRRGEIRRTLCLSFGFGSQNPVLALAQAST